MMVVANVSAELMRWIFGLIFTPSQLADMHHMVNQIVSFAAFGIGFSVALAVMKHWIKIPSRVAFPRKKGHFSVTFPAIFICLGVSILGSILYVFLSMMMEAGFGISTSSPDFTPPRGALPIAVFLISLTVLPSILEELLFRGVIMQSLRRFGDGFALIVSSILFGIIHLNLAQAIPAFLSGLLIGYFVLRTGSIWTGIIIHFVNNSIAAAQLLITHDAGDEMLIATNMFIITFYLLSGSVAFMYLFFRERGTLFRLAPSAVPVREGKKYLYFFTATMAIVFCMIAVIITSLVWMS